jgi:hypothetical protein
MHSALGEWVGSYLKKIQGTFTAEPMPRLRDVEDGGLASSSAVGAFYATPAFLSDCPILFAICKKQHVWMCGGEKSLLWHSLCCLQKGISLHESQPAEPPSLLVRAQGIWQTVGRLAGFSDAGGPANAAAPDRLMSVEHRSSGFSRLSMDSMKFTPAESSRVGSSELPMHHRPL